MVIFATSNKGKYLSAKKSLSKLNIDVEQAPFEFAEPRGTLEEVSKEKAYQAYQKIQKPVFVIDAGFFLEEYPEFPGAQTNFALETLGLKGLGKLAESNPKCGFKEVLTYFDGKNYRQFKSEVYGTWVEPVYQENGWSWSKLHYVFKPDIDSRTLSQIKLDEWEKIKQKAGIKSAIQLFGEWYTTR